MCNSYENKFEKESNMPYIWLGGICAQSLYTKNENFIAQIKLERFVMQ